VEGIAIEPFHITIWLMDTMNKPFPAHSAPKFKVETLA
jgi:hypothetical protein